MTSANYMELDGVTREFDALAHEPPPPPPAPRPAQTRSEPLPTYTHDGGHVPSRELYTNKNTGMSQPRPTYLSAAAIVIVLFATGAWGAAGILEYKRSELASKELHRHQELGRQADMIDMRDNSWRWFACGLVAWLCLYAGRRPV